MALTVPSILPVPLLHRNKFGVEINGFELAIFSKCKLPEVEFDEITFSPAGSAFDQKTAGRAKYADIALEKGIIQLGADDAAMTWFKTILEANTSLGSPAPVYMRNVDIILYDDLGVENRRFTLFGAFVKKLEYGDADASVSENVIEIVTICYQYFIVT